jgi:hypothetical protein
MAAKAAKTITLRIIKFSWLISSQIVTRLKQVPAYQPVDPLA